MIALKFSKLLSAIPIELYGKPCPAHCLLLPIGQACIYVCNTPRLGAPRHPNTPL